MGPLFSIEQRLTAAVQFTGAVPTGEKTVPTSARLTNHVLWRYAALVSVGVNAAGGRFDPRSLGNDPSYCWRMKRMTLSLGGQSAWRVDILDQDNVVRLASWLSGTTQASAITERFDEILLAPGEKLALYTTAMTAAAVASAMFERV